jgi:NADPH2:quinone reductase
MKAVQIKSLVSSTDQLEVTSLPDLPTSKDLYVVQVQAAGTNFFDALQVQGKHQNKPPLPFIAGNEFAGVVLKTPTGSSQHAFKVGDRVFGGELGAFATQIYAKAEDMRRIPDNWTPLEASGIFLTAPTAYAALVHRAHAKAG